MFDAKKTALKFKELIEISTDQVVLEIIESLNIGTDTDTDFFKKGILQTMFCHISNEIEKLEK